MLGIILWDSIQPVVKSNELIIRGIENFIDIDFDLRSLKCLYTLLTCFLIFFIYFYKDCNKVYLFSKQAVYNVNFTIT